MGTPPGPTAGVGGGGGTVPGVDENVILAIVEEMGVAVGVASVEDLFSGVEVLLTRALALRPNI